MAEQGKLVLVRRGQAQPTVNRSAVHRNAALAIRDRQMHGRPLRKVFDAIPKRMMVPLEGIIDRHREILHGCILLGFTKDGDHLISYSCATDERLEGDATPRHHYRVQFWTFRGFEPLVKRAEVSLFGSQHEGIPSWGTQARISIFESPDERFFVAHCTVPPSSPDDTSLLENFVSMFETPLCQRAHSILCSSFSYLGINPAPPFNPALTFLRPNVLALHCGSGLRFVCLSLALRELISESTGDTDDDLSSTPLPLSSEPPCKLPELADIRCPAAWLHDDTGLTQKGVAAMTDAIKRPDSHFSSLAVEAERVFDVESYLASLRNTDQRFTKHSIVDYELTVIEICARDRTVTCLLTVMIRSEANTLTTLCFWLSICPSSGNVTIAGSFFHAAKSAADATRHCIQQLQGRVGQPCAFRHSILVWSNKGVLQSGKSMVVLLHPVEPIAIVKQTGN